jgi:competence protein ComEC
VPAGAEPNDRAVVLLVRRGALDLLLTADAESPVTGPLDLPPVDVLKVAHHGSADPGLPALLDRLRPSIAAIEVGRDNPYGHPTAATLAALRAVVPTVVRTDVDGTVRLTLEGDRIAVR